MTGRRFALLAAVTVALAGLLTAATWAGTRAWVGGTNTMMGGGSPMTGGAGMMGGGSPMMGGAGMMGGFAQVGDGRPVGSLEAARQRAQVFADRLGLGVGEVMQFSNGFYAELETRGGALATEVLVDPTVGSVSIEYGPAMMWNTDYGMHGRAATGTTQVASADAQKIAQRWLDERRPGLTAGEPELFPGYFTLHTMQDGAIVGMMSVNAYTGAVWYHTWHGSYVAMSEG